MKILKKNRLETQKSEVEAQLTKLQEESNGKTALLAESKEEIAVLNARLEDGQILT